MIGSWNYSKCPAAYIDPEGYSACVFWAQFPFSAIPWLLVLVLAAVMLTVIFRGP